MYLDVHCHFTQMDPQIQESQFRQMKNDQVACIAVIEKTGEVQQLLEIVQRAIALNVRIIPFVGIHPINPETQRPVDGRDCSAETLELMKLLVEKKTAFGIGEIGLDYSPHFYAFCNRNQELIAQVKKGQKAVFTAQLLLAKELDVFVNVHSRQAGHYAINHCLDMGIRKAIFHAFDGKAKYALDAVAKQRQYFFSIPGSIARDPQLQQLATRLPLENMLVESDAPALPPAKDRISQPTNVIETIAFIAQIRNIDKNELEKMIWKNSLIVLGDRD